MARSLISVDEIRAAASWFFVTEAIVVAEL